MRNVWLFMVMLVLPFSVTVFAADTLPSSQKVAPHKTVKDQGEKKTKKTMEVHHQLTGQWKNDGGSILIIETQSDNSLNGTYFTSFSKTKDCLEKPLPVSGYFDGHIFSASVNFSGCHANLVLSMTGYLSKDDVLHVLTVVQKGVSDRENIRTLSTDVFERKNG